MPRYAIMECALQARGSMNAEYMQVAQAGPHSMDNRWKHELESKLEGKHWSQRQLTIMVLLPACYWLVSGKLEMADSEFHTPSVEMARGKS